MFLELSVDHTHLLSNVRRSKTAQPPPSPLTTSSLQQHANSVLSIRPKETMSICQRLYEKGLITYMRTDSTAYSPAFIKQAASAITREYGQDHVGPRASSLAARGVGKESQEAHEAIRPTDPARMALAGEECAREKRMYKLIWQRAMESCMADAQVASAKGTITAPEERTYSLLGQDILFDGWKAVRGTATQAHEQSKKTYNRLLALKENGPVALVEADSKAALTNKKTRQTEATLVRQLETRGIGRPSTYASLVAKIQDRGYVKLGDVAGRRVECTDLHLDMDEAEITETTRTAMLGVEKNKLLLQPVGQAVHDLLLADFGELFAYGYTRDLEGMLDRVASGEMNWAEACRVCDSTLDGLLLPWKERMASGGGKLQIRIDPDHTYLIGRYGPVVRSASGGKTTFKAVRSDLDMDKLKAGSYSLSEILAPSKEGEVLGEHEGHPVTLKHGRYGAYVEWNGARRSVPKQRSKEVAAARQSGEDRPSVSLADVLPLLCHAGPSELRTIDSKTTIRNGPHGDYIMHKASKKGKPRFISLTPFIELHGKDSYKTCDVEVIREWLKTQGVDASAPATARTRGGRAGRRHAVSRHASD